MRPEYLILIAIFFDAAVNGVQDNINFHKNGLPLKDLWHILKQIDRVLLIAIGFIAAKIEWNWLNIIALLFSLVFAKQVWSWFYRNHVGFWYWYDERFKIKTFEWLDRLTGLDK